MRQFLIIFFSFTAGCLNGQNNLIDSNVRTDRIFDDNVRTIQLFREEWNLSYPVISLKSKDKLALKFDLVKDVPESYYYTFVHCDKDWKESGLFVPDYLDGFEENPIDDYKPSFNTTVSYYHYSLVFPNERIRFKVSGNYIIKVYEPGKNDEPVFTKRFIISEDAGTVTATAQRPRMAGENYNSHQQVDFTFNYSGLNLNDPFRNIYASVFQNGRWDAARTNLKADFQGNNELKYSSLSDKLTFPGGNEFRYFDIKSLRYQTEYVRSVDFFLNNYNVYLQPSENREFKPYFYQQDFNGKYVIAFQEGRNPDTDGDYVNVYFTLPGKEVGGGNIHVAGAFTDWTPGGKNLMRYNARDAQYECTMLLKQGWYNYEYLFLPAQAENAIRGPFEGNHYETENDYLIIIYYRNPRERFDRVLVTETINTLNKIRD